MTTLCRFWEKCVYKHESLAQTRRKQYKLAPSMFSAITDGFVSHPYSCFSRLLHWGLCVVCLYWGVYGNALAQPKHTKQTSYSQPVCGNSHVMSGAASSLKPSTCAPASASPKKRLKASYVRGKGFQVDFFGDRSWVLTLGGMAFARGEFITNLKDTQFAKDDSDAYVASRFRLHIDLLTWRHVGIAATIQDARFWGSGLPQNGHVEFRPDTNATFGREVFLGFSLFEGYMYIDRPWNLPLRLEVGRMILEYGSGYTFGDPAYAVQGQSLDTIRLRWTPGRWTIDALWVKVRANIERTDQDTCANGCIFEGDDVAGLYASWKPMASMTWDLYGFLYRRAPLQSGPAEPSHIGIFGSRYAINTGGFRASLEVILEVGRHQQKTLLGFSTLAKAIYSFPVKTQPFIGFQFLTGSGDGDDADQIDNAFVPLFARRRRFYGMLALFAATNLIQPTLIVGFKPHRTFTIHVDVRESFLWDPRGAILSGGHTFLARNPNGTRRALGMEIDMFFSWRPYRFLLFDLVGGIFLPSAGDALSEMLDAQGNKKFGNDPAMLLYLRSWVSF